ncbi:hypothetical protein DM01DRAFT_1120059 [Hesseltinella vesiculosa]|uniref:Uncharacterized protein n=1 Tax=Hesseltinella vesiculosa TaxID=101127 RepID=A0A1X2GTN2_9FUNG|nr:hypothetical protein DM01DRAFT_1120059 [Hesseltinella vesiculosa]
MNDPDHRQPLLCFLAGMALSVMGYSFYSHFEKTRPAETTPSDTSLHTQRDSTLEDDIPLHSLIYLVNSTHATIQSCSVKVAIERAMSDTC